MFEFKDKLSKVEETSVVKQWVAGFVDLKTNEIHNRIDRTVTQVNEKVDNIVQT